MLSFRFEKLRTFADRSNTRARKSCRSDPFTSGHINPEKRSSIVEDQLSGHCGP